MRALLNDRTAQPAPAPEKKMMLAYDYVVFAVWMALPGLIYVYVVG